MTQALVVIPARNEASKVGSVVHRTVRCGFRVLVVDDSSSDRTAAVAARCGAEIASAGTRGYSGAVITGLRYGIDRAYDNIVTVDADGAHDPADILPSLVRHISTDAAMTIGTRDFTRMPAEKAAANAFARDVVNHVLACSLADVCCGFRILRRQFAGAIVQRVESEGFQLPYEMIRLALKLGEAIATTPVSVTYPQAPRAFTHQGELLDGLAFALMAATADLACATELKELYRQAALLLPLETSIGDRTYKAIPNADRQSYHFVQSPSRTTSPHVTGRPGPIHRSP